MGKYVTNAGLTEYRRLDKIEKDGIRASMIASADVNAIAGQITLAPSLHEFVRRASPALCDGVFKVKSFRGKSLVWNQLVQNPTFANNAQGWSREGDDATITDGVYSAKVTSAGKWNIYREFTAPSNHIKLHLATMKADSPVTILMTATNASTPKSIGTSWSVVSTFITSGGQYCNTFVNADTSVAGVRIYAKNKVIYDLTQLFGAGNEPTTYEEFLQRKPIVEDEYAYDEETIINNKVEKVASTGIQLWDEQWESGRYDDNGVKVSGSGIRSKNYIPIADASKPYHFRFPNNIVLCKVIAFDSALNSLGVWWYIRNDLNNNKAFADKFPSAKYFVFSIEYYGTTYNHDICINISNPSINGQYFPYEEHALDLSWIREIKDENGVVLFEDGMRSAGSVYDEVGSKRAIKRIGNDGEILATPIEVEYAERKMFSPTSLGGEEYIVAEGDTTPISMEAGYPLNLRSLFTSAQSE